MATYTVKPSQNIFDVALECYGSIEGLFDLLISNDNLNMTSDLTPGMELEYHDYFTIEDSIIQAIKDNNYLCANSERHVYYKDTDQPCRFIVGVSAGDDMSTFKASGQGDMYVDWGDNSDLEHIQLSVTEGTYQHYFDNVVDSRRIVVYGDFALNTFDATEIGGGILPVMTMTVDEFTNRSNGYTLKGLFLFEGTDKVDLQEMDIDDLLPIADMSLQELDLRNVKFSSIDVLDDYLEYIVQNYGSRRNCTVRLTDYPGTRGVAAMNTILGEEAWNEAGDWQFIINDNLYTIS